MSEPTTTSDRLADTLIGFRQRLIDGDVPVDLADRLTTDFERWILTEPLDFGDLSHTLEAEQS